ncbi:MAG TPA: type II secretion system protein [Terriglobia bacterium]|nr:type II secretion system protein [Terriglobia bacterium]
MRFSGTNPKRRSRLYQAGFSLLELILVIAILGILMAVARPTWDAAKQRSKEVRLAASLHMMRQAINQYVADKGKLPESLDSLVAGGYIAEVPVDPITGTRTWNPDLGKLPGSSDLFSSGVRDVHSTSEALSQGLAPGMEEPAPYNTW